MSILAGYFVPHPPIIIPEVGRGEEKKIQQTIDAYRSIAKQIQSQNPDTIVVSSPHAPSYREHVFIDGNIRQYGNLHHFGASHVEVNVSLDVELGKSIQKQVSSKGFSIGSVKQFKQPLDHGSLIPLLFVLQEYNDFELVRLSPSSFSNETHVRLGEIIADAIPEDKRVVWIASGDLSHTLKKNGPYGFTKEGVLFDQIFQQIVRQIDLDALFHLDDALVAKAAVCGLGSFSMMLGAMLHQGPVESSLLSYQDTFGVGYAVASFLPKKDVK